MSLADAGILGPAACHPVEAPRSPTRRNEAPGVLGPHTAASQRRVRMPVMAFGQQSGPPASAMQVRELLALLKDAGHSDFRDARGPMGFTQRQAGGKFSRDEAAAFIAQLLDAESDPSAAVAAPAWRQSAQQQMVSSLTSEQLAGELRRRGWTVMEP
jgi:hypothetical protein